MQSLKFIYRIIFLAFMVFAVPAKAQIPVTDAAQISTNIMNQIETVAKWVQQFQQMKAQLDHMKAHLDALSGSRGMGNAFNNQELNTILPDNWESVLDEIKASSTFKSERNKYPTNDKRPKLNAMYDEQALTDATMIDFFDKLQLRVKQVIELSSKIDNASDPAAKQDLANRLAHEQNAIVANQNLLAMLQARQRQAREYSSIEASKEYSCKEFKKC